MGKATVVRSGWRGCTSDGLNWPPWPSRRLHKRAQELNKRGGRWTEEATQVRPPVISGPAFL